MLGRRRPSIKAPLDQLVAFVRMDFPSSLECRTGHPPSQLSAGDRSRCASHVSIFLLYHVQGLAFVPKSDENFPLNILSFCTSISRPPISLWEYSNRINQLHSGVDLLVDRLNRGWTTLLLAQRWIPSSKIFLSGHAYSVGWHQWYLVLYGVVFIAYLEFKIFQNFQNTKIQFVQLSIVEC